MTAVNGQRLLVIAPHPDDEVIGCGGLIARIKQEGGKVFVLFLTNGDAKDFSKTGFSTQSERKKEIEKVAKYMQFDGYDIAFEGNSYHLKLDDLPQYKLISMNERESPVSIEKIKPTILASPHFTSYNHDHRAAANAVFTASRPANKKDKFQPNVFLTYESPADKWSMETNGNPNYFVELSSDHLAKKIKSLRLYKSQLRNQANLRSPQALKSIAVLRGSLCGSSYAEAYDCLRLTV